MAAAVADDGRHHNNNSKNNGEPARQQPLQLHQQQRVVAAGASPLRSSLRRRPPPPPQPPPQPPPSSSSGTVEQTDNATSLQTAVASTATAAAAAPTAATFASSGMPLPAAISIATTSTLSDGIGGGSSSGVDSPRSPSARKTVSFCSTHNEKRVSNVADCWAVMRQGAELLKLVRVRSGVRQFRRFYSLDADHAHIRWTPSNKKPHKARIAIDSIREIRIGRYAMVESTGRDDDEDGHTDGTMGAPKMDPTAAVVVSGTAASPMATSASVPAECAFAIIHGSSAGELLRLDLVAPSADDASIWTTGLLALIADQADVIGSSAFATVRERWIESTFDRVANGSEFLTEDGALEAAHRLNPRLAAHRIRHRFKEIAFLEDELRVIRRSGFVDLYKELATRPEVYFLMVRYANKDYLTMQDLRLFLETEQGALDVTTEQCRRIVESHEPCEQARQNGLMTVDGFTAYLLSESANVCDTSRTAEVWQDMRRPFADYFIASSHRCYLVEEQSGVASSHGIESALSRGCRLVDLTLHEPCEPSGDPPQPVVCSAPDARSRLPLEDALRAVLTAGFIHSSAPLILRLDVQIQSAHWQRQTYRMLREILGEQLYVPNNDPIDWSGRQPTPSDFNMRILIMGKKLPSSLDSTSVGEVSDDDDDSGGGGGSQSYSSLTLSDHTSIGGRLRRTLIRELSDLVPDFLRVSRLRPSDLSLSTRSPSVGGVRWNRECDALCLLQSSGADRILHAARTRLLYTMPNVLRTDSSNLSPQELWNGGVQLVALNYQTPGLMMDLQEGRFLENGGCGYVLRPDAQIDEGFSIGARQAQVMRVRILSGQQLGRPRGATARGHSADPFVVIELFGAPGDCAEQRTRTARNESWTPVWDEAFQFVVEQPDLALVRFLVLDDDFIGDDFIGQRTLPFDCLQPGYRHVRLLNSEGDPLEGATLFVHVAVTNKRGGGKAKRRGMSVRRKGPSISSSTAMKTVGIARLDDIFKTAALAVSEAQQLKGRLESALAEKEDTAEIRHEAGRRLAEIETALDAAAGPLSQIERLCSEEDVKGQKGTRAKENATWNVRLLQTQRAALQRMQRTKKDEDDDGGH